MAQMKFFPLLLYLFIHANPDIGDLHGLWMEENCMPKESAHNLQTALLFRAFTGCNGRDIMSRESDHNLQTALLSGGDISTAGRRQGQ